MVYKEQGRQLCVIALAVWASLFRTNSSALAQTDEDVWVDILPTGVIPGL